MNSFWGFEWAKGQLEIMRAINNPEINRLIISACTRYGKTRAVAVATLMYLRENKNVSVVLLAPKSDQTSIIRNYISEHIAQEPELKALIETSGKGSAPERLKKEASRKRVTFKGNRELQTHTAGGNLMGFGGDLIILDQSEGIPDEKYRGEISRMLGDSPDSKLVEIINPWVRNHVWDHWNSERFERIHIDYKQAINEGRLTEGFVEEQRQELTDYEFTVLYKALFPEESEKSLFKYSWLEEAQEREIQIEGKHVWGLDVAEGGADSNVLTHTVQGQGLVKVKKQYKWDESDTMKTVGKTTSVLNDSKVDEIRVDKIGIGKGVADRLEENGFNVKQIHVGKSSEKDKDRFKNLKAEGYMGLRDLFEMSNISIPEAQSLVRELASMEKEHTSSGKVQIIDPSKSPDRADSLMLACLEKVSKSPGLAMMDLG